MQNYTCEISDETCILQNLYLTTTNKHFQLEPNHVISKIEDVWIRASKIEVLTNDICQTLLYVKVFDSSKAGLIDVDENAFVKCTKLETIDLSMNSLTSLPPGTFFWNSNLKYVYLWNNKLTEIDENFFKYNENLIKIALNGNFLKVVPTNLFRNLVNLKNLWMQANQISDLSFLEEMPTVKSLKEIRLDFNKIADVFLERLLMNFPNLKEINLNENEFWCERVSQLIDLLSERGVKYDEMSGCIQNRDEWETTRNLRIIERKQEMHQKSKTKQVKQTMSTKDEL